MSANELFIIESDKKYSLAEVKNFLQQFTNDLNKEIMNSVNRKPEDVDVAWYLGKINGFYICRKLLDHVEGDKNEKKCGYWIVDDSRHFLPYKCSVCGEWNEGRTTYCPDCGSRMERGCKE